MKRAIKDKQTSLWLGKSLRNESNPEVSAPLKLKMDCRNMYIIQIQRARKENIIVKQQVNYTSTKVTKEKQNTWSSSPTIVMWLWDARIFKRLYCMALVSWNSSITMDFHEFWHSLNTYDRNEQKKSKT